MKKTKISTAIQRAGSTGFVVDTSNDAELFKESPVVYNWDDLLTLKDELAKAIMEFIAEVRNLAINQEVISMLGDKTDHFNQTVSIFFNDITSFSNKVKELREQHEHKSGVIEDLDEMGLYNRLAMGYHAAYNELNILIAPTLGELMLTVSECVNVPVEESSNE